MPPFAGINEFYLGPLVVFGGMESFTALILSAPGFNPPVVNRCLWKLTVVFSNSQFSRLRVRLWSSICWSSILNCGFSSPLLQPWYNLCCWGLVEFLWLSLLSGHQTDLGCSVLWTQRVYIYNFSRWRRRSLSALILHSGGIHDSHG